jgi:uncharacterized paraquat-inducible protein A
LLELTEGIYLKIKYLYRRKIMIKVYKEELLKNTTDYEEYSQNIYKLTLEELRAEGLLKCGGCCLKKEKNKNKCTVCNSENSCKK